MMKLPIAEARAKGEGVQGRYKEGGGWWAMAPSPPLSVEQKWLTGDILYSVGEDLYPFL